MLLVAGDRDEIVGADRRRRVTGHVMEQCRIRAWPSCRGDRGTYSWRSGGGGAGGAASADLVQRAGPGERSGVRFSGRVLAKRYVTRGFDVSVRVLPLPRRTGPGQRRPVVEGCDPWLAPGGSGGRSGCMGRRRATGRLPYFPGREKKLRPENSGVREELRTHDSGSAMSAGSARFGRSSGTVDRHRRYLRVGTFKGPSSLRSRVGVGTVRLTWLIKPAAKFR